MISQCDMCGAPDVAVNDRKYCVDCEQVDLATSGAAADTVLAALTALLDVALAARANPEDVRAVVEDRIAHRLADRAYSAVAPTLRELAESENRNYERRQRTGVVDETIDAMERQFRARGGGER